MRAAVFAAAFPLAGLAVATADSPQHLLPVGTAVVFVSDGHLDANARPGSAVGAHLRESLILDGVPVAPGGAKARIRFTGSTTDPNGHRELAIAVDRFVIFGGTMPVTVIEPVVASLEPGTTIAAKTQAIVERLGDRYSIRVPFPFPLSGDRPAAYYTPTPARTAPPNSMVPRTRGGPPTAAPTATPTPAATPSGDAVPSANPSPAATKIP